MKARARLVCVAIAVLIAGCQAGTGQLACPLPGQTRMISLKLYFGRDIQGGGFVTDQAFAGFAAAVLNPAFPDGFTAYEATGQWRNPQNGQIVREKTFVVEVAGPIGPTAVAAAVDAYRKAFRQVSVGAGLGRCLRRFLKRVLF